MKKRIKIVFIIMILLNCFPWQSVKASNKEIKLVKSWQYASFSKVNSGSSILYKSISKHNNIVVAINAGHGTKGGSSAQTLSHPDGSPKVTGGTTEAGNVTSTAVSGGTVFLDGISEATIALKTAKLLKDYLLNQGYDVLMIRDQDDVQLDNIARTVIANNNADIHISLHWDSTTTDKGVFYISVPNVSTYRNMEPVKSYYQKHHQLGETLISELKKQNIKIYGTGSMALDLTQTSYSTIPSIDIELGDRASKHDDVTLSSLAKGLLDGINEYFGIDNNSSIEKPNDSQIKDDEVNKPDSSMNNEDKDHKSNSNYFYNIIKYTVPSLVILISFILFVSDKISKNVKKNKYASKRLLQRIIISIIIFLILFIIGKFL